jgi:hypothetical protein
MEDERRSMIVDSELDVKSVGLRVAGEERVVRYVYSPLPSSGTRFSSLFLQAQIEIIRAAEISAHNTFLFMQILLRGISSDI